MQLQLVLKVKLRRGAEEGGSGAQQMKKCIDLVRRAAVCKFDVARDGKFRKMGSCLSGESRPACMPAASDVDDELGGGGAGPPQSTGDEKLVWMDQPMRRCTQLDTNTHMVV